MPTHCCVPNCLGKGGHRFPKNKKMRDKWISAVKRENPDHSKWLPPSETTLICKMHFKQDDYCTGDTLKAGKDRKIKRLKRSAIPSVFSWIQLPQDELLNREDRNVSRNKKKDLHLPTTSDSDKQQPSEDVFLHSDLNIGAEEIIDSVENNDCFNSNVSSNDFTDSNDININETITVPEQPNPLKKPYLSFESISNSDKLVNHYTGLDSKSIFLTVFWSLGPNVNNLNYIYTQSCGCLDPKDQLLLMLVRLRHHYPILEIARMFDVSIFTVQNIFITWVNFCAIQWGKINIWPNKILSQLYCPSDFKRKFPTTRVILDATEIPIQIPSNPRTQRATFSTYKHRNTVKVLVGCTPGGLVSYISDAYGGSASDRQLVERSKLFDLCESGDSIMADKGFNVQDIFAKKNITLNIPTFFKKKNRLQPLTVIKDRFISSKRVHVERIIGMAKIYKICKHPLNSTETRLASQILKVCFYLCNFRKNIVPSHS